MPRLFRRAGIPFTPFPFTQIFLDILPNFSIIIKPVSYVETGILAPGLKPGAICP